LAKAPDKIDRSAAPSSFSYTLFIDSVISVPLNTALIRPYTYSTPFLRVRIINSVSHSFQLIIEEGVRDSGVVKAGEDRKRGEDYRIGEVRGLGVYARRFYCFWSCLYSFIFDRTTSGLSGISPVFLKEFRAIMRLLKTLS
jgi:hypothetical protein